MASFPLLPLHLRGVIRVISENNLDDQFTFRHLVLCFPFVPYELKSAHQLQPDGSSAGTEDDGHLRAHWWTIRIGVFIIVA